MDDRNESAHPNGNIFYSTEAALDIKITEILRVGAEIQTHSKPVIEHCYRDFLLQNHDPDEREYVDAADQIREVLIHGNYLSQKDIGICQGFDVESLADRPGIEGMRELHAALVEKYTVEDATRPAKRTGCSGRRCALPANRRAGRPFSACIHIGVGSVRGIG